MASYLATVLAAAALLRPAAAQNPGSTPENHPPLTTYKCTTSGGCVSQSTSVVLDWNYRYIHSGSTNCVANGVVSQSLCPDEATCAKNCVVEGADYASAGVSTSGSSLTMYQYVNGQGASPRLYLLGADGNYVDMKLLGQELTFDVDLSTLPCGENGALYLSQMDMTGYRSTNNQGGANYGNGYCDAQGPVQGWWRGVVNRNSSVSACNEMDILEANSQAAAMTPHPCASDTSCDKGGCPLNAYAQGHHNYWAPGGTVDTSRPFTITTQFVTSDGTTTGTLTKIVRQYIQDGKIVASANQGGDFTTEDTCNAADGSNAANGGLPTMGRALGQGMVLVFSIWNDNSQFMNWLDSGSSGPCSSSAGNPATILANNPDTHVVFSNIRWGDIGSTFGKPSGGNPPPSSSQTKTTTTKMGMTTTTKPVQTTAPPSGGPTQSHWGQCGGIGYSGPTACAAPYACQSSNPWYSQCL